MVAISINEYKIKASSLILQMFQIANVVFNFVNYYTTDSGCPCNLSIKMKWCEF